MQFSTVEIRFIVTTYLYSTFANDLKRKYFFSKNVHSYRVCSFKLAENLSWNKHVGEITKKANNTLAFLWRNISRCPSEIKAQCYTSLIRPVIEYAATARDPYTARNIQQLEAARFVTGDYKTTSSTNQMIANLSWSSLQQRRTEAWLVMMYRITHDLVDIPVAQYLHPATVMHIRGPSQRYMLPFCRTDVYRHSFFPAGIRLWNQLPEHVATAQTLDSFKAGLADLY